MRSGIPVSNVPEYSTDSVAQHVFALLLELCVQVGVHAQAVRAGEWSRLPDFSMRKTPLLELAGKTMGIVGFGRIGQRVGNLPRRSGCQSWPIVLHDAHPRTADRSIGAS